MKSSIARMFDANANRAREAYRVLEDYARFALASQPLAGQIKADRHQLAAILKTLGLSDSFFYRDASGDVGIDIKAVDELQRRNLADVVAASGKRLAEALRVMEELAKTIWPEAARTLESMRYRGYTVEQSLLRAAGGQQQQSRLATVRLCVLLTESLCRHPWRKTLDALLVGGVDCVQLREKCWADAALLDRARVVVAACRAAGVLAIINDRTDIAVLAGADGVHLGQGDLPCAEARKITGSDFIIGVSTATIAQGRQAVLDGASYIGVGPMFPTSTKPQLHVAGPAYAQVAVAEMPVACIAIGGITAENIGALTAVGVTAVAVCSAVLGAEDPRAVCVQIKSLLATTSPQAPPAITGIGKPSNHWTTPTG
ncbi:MAG: thiamine phosphate synthase [Phycisphaerae bacterium]|nr:thiamine phosphate synthase [Phycisphaerae bacterium]